VNFIGNKQAVMDIIQWLNEFYHKKVSTICPHCSFPIISELNENIYCPNCKKSFSYHRKVYAIIYGNTGCGKTYLIKQLAKEFNVNLLRITPIDIENGKSIRDLQKSLNITSLDGDNNKLILIDDVDDYKSNLKKQFFNLTEISEHPIVFVKRTFPSSLERGNNGGALVIELKKPITKELLGYLQTISNLPEDKLEEIARSSPSFRSAVISAKTSMVNDLIVPYKSKYQKLKDVKERKFDEPLNRKNIKWLFNCIRGADEDAYQFMENLARFDYLIRYKYMEIDPFILNSLPINYDNIKLEQRFTETPQKKQQPKKLKKVVVKEKQVKEQKVPEKQSADLSNWF